jgi:hypothetical protein
MALGFIKAVADSTLFQAGWVGCNDFIDAGKSQMLCLGGGTQIDQHIVVTRIRQLGAYHYRFSAGIFMWRVS